MYGVGRSAHDASRRVRRACEVKRAGRSAVAIGWRSAAGPSDLAGLPSGGGARRGLPPSAPAGRQSAHRGGRLGQGTLAQPTGWPLAALCVGAGAIAAHPRLVPLHDRDHEPDQQKKPAGDEREQKGALRTEPSADVPSLTPTVGTETAVLNHTHGTALTHSFRWRLGLRAARRSRPPDCGKARRRGRAAGCPQDHTIRGQPRACGGR